MSIIYDDVKEIFYLSGEDIYWKERPRSDFNSERTFKAFNKHKANSKVSRTENKKGYGTVSFRVGGGFKQVPYHRLKYTLHNKTTLEDNFVVDHIDNNPRNDNLSNLRAVNRSQNALNTMQNRGGKLKGIYKSNKGWIVAVGKNKRCRTFCEAVKLRSNYLANVFTA